MHNFAHKPSSNLQPIHWLL